MVYLMKYWRIEDGLAYYTNRRADVSICIPVSELNADMIAAIKANDRSAAIEVTVTAYKEH